MYTTVLLSNLDLERTKMNKNENICGADLDVISRRRLKDLGKGYGHGTGHGVGFCLNVHEGPHSLSPTNKIPLRKGMVVTNEPGYYEEGNFGIRIENMLTIKDDNREEDKLCFHNFTRVPYDPNLIEESLLSEDEKKHIKNYHELIYEDLKDHLDGDKSSKQYIEDIIRQIK